jgi:proteasome component ECM29
MLKLKRSPHVNISKSAWPGISKTVFALHGTVTMVNLSCRSITLPVAALLKQYKDNPSSSMIRHFDLMFIQQSIGKLTASVCALIFSLDHY